MFEAYNNHSHHEATAASSGIALAAGNRTLRGQLAGCRLLTPNASNGIESSVASCTAPRDSHGGFSTSMVDFGVVRPDWLGNTARLEFRLILEVGDQEFLTEVVNLDFRPPGAPQRGHPAARQLRRRQGLRRCGRHRGHGEGQGVRPTRGHLDVHNNNFAEKTKRWISTAARGASTWPAMRIVAWGTRWVSPRPQR